MFPTLRFGLGLVLLAGNASAVSLATIGDSFADSIYFGLRARPALLKQNGIELIRWSRPSIGLVRTDQFDYTAWLRDTAELGAADFCMVQLGTNDMQSIPDRAGQWVRFPGDAWKGAYRDRVAQMAATLHKQRCRRVIWVLQPGFEKSKFLSGNRALINELQVAGIAASRDLVLDVDAETGDYGHDGIHFSGPFTLKLADAAIRIVTTWRDRVPESCFACHSTIPAASQIAAANLAAVRIRAPGSLVPAALLAEAAAPRSIVPPRAQVKVLRTAVSKAPVRRRRHRA